MTNRSRLLFIPLLCVTASLVAFTGCQIGWYKS